MSAWRHFDSKRYPHRVGLAVFVVMVLAAVVMYLDLWGHLATAAPIPLVNASKVAPVTVRTVGTELRRRDTGEACHECHSDMERPDKDPVLDVEEHKRHLNHGRNKRCFNCHQSDPKKRDQFIDDDGSPIPYGEVVRLCARCHGPHYRDWKAGAHGRRNGYWDTTRGEQRPQLCIACHDPHSPHFTTLAALPGPNTLHDGPMGEHK